MNPVQLHLIFNHWPLILLAVAFVILLVGERKDNITYKSLGLILIAVAAGFTILSQFTGGGAMEYLEANELADKYYMQEHAGFGFWTAMFVYVMGVLALLALYMLHNIHSFYTLLRRFLILAALIGFILMGITAHTGGEIRRPELQHQHD